MCIGACTLVIYVSVYSIPYSEFRPRRWCRALSYYWKVGRLLKMTNLTWLRERASAGVHTSGVRLCKLPLTWRKRFAASTAWNKAYNNGRPSWRVVFRSDAHVKNPVLKYVRIWSVSIISCIYQCMRSIFEKSRNCYFLDELSERKKEKEKERNRNFVREK